MSDSKKIGLALSGGGVRASAFHLGVFDKLNELGVLEKVDVLSTVSGGSITGAFYMTEKVDFNRFKKLMIENLKKSVEKGIAFNWRFICAILSPFYSRTDVKSSVYDKLYYHNKTFSSLDKKPKLIINATNLATGKNWKFSQEYMGDWIIGYEGKVKNFKISKAVAASSAVPGVFFPIKIKVKDYFDNPKYKIKKLALSDGGVYDNQGTHALTSDYAKNDHCDYIICSDASFPFDSTPGKVPFRLVGVLSRQSNVMMARIKNIQFQNLMYGGFKSSVKTAYFSINWTKEGILKSILKNDDLQKKLGIKTVPSKDNIKMSIMELEQELNYPEFKECLQAEGVKKASSIGTRLRKLSDEEINLLMKHGSTLCGIQVRTFLKDILP